MLSGPPSPNLGGPLGFGGLVAMAAAAIGLGIVGLTGDDEPPEGPSQSAQILQSAEEESVYAPAAVPVRGPVHFIVRFEDHPKLAEAKRLFKSDPEAATDAFEAFCEGRPQLEKLRLLKINYSGEFILKYEGAAKASTVKAALQRLPEVKYADPDYTAYPGKAEE